MTATGPQPVSYAAYNCAAIGAVSSPRARQTNTHCQAHMADGFEESWRAYFPIYNLRHVFCTGQLGCTRRGGTAGDTA